MVLFSQKDLIVLLEIFLKHQFLKKKDGYWIDFLRTITKQYKNKTHSSTKLTPSQGSLKKIEGYVYKNLSDKRKKTKQKFQVNDLVRTADLKKTLLKGDTTNWSYKLYKTTGTINDKIPSYRIDNLKESYNETLFKKLELTMKDNDGVMKKMNIT